MQSRAVGAAAVAMVITASAASAADISRPYPYYSVPVYGYSWAGPYFGLTLGGQWGSVTNFPARPAGVEGGIEAGRLLEGRGR